MLGRGHIAPYRVRWSGSPRLVRGWRWRGGRACFLAILSLALCLAVPSVAGANVWVHWRLDQGFPYDVLNGTHASITTSESALNLNNNCFAARSDVEGHKDGGAYDSVVFQTGWVRCSSGASVDNGECAKDYRQVQYIEIIPPSNVATCYPLGTISNGVNVLYGVRQATGTNVWSAWVSGVQQTPTYTFANPDFLVEGGEYTGSCTEAQNGPTDIQEFPFGWTVEWERLSNTWSWVGVTAADPDIHTQQCGFNTDGGPPGNWGIYR